MAIDFYYFVQPCLSWGESEQISNVPLPSSGIVHKTIFVHHTAARNGMLEPKHCVQLPYIGLFEN